MSVEHVGSRLSVDEHLGRCLTNGLALALSHYRDKVAASRAELRALDAAFTQEIGPIDEALHKSPGGAESPEQFMDRLDSRGPTAFVLLLKRSDDGASWGLGSWLRRNKASFGESQYKTLSKAAQYLSRGIGTKSLDDDLGVSARLRMYKRNLMRLEVSNPHEFFATMLSRPGFGPRLAQALLTIAEMQMPDDYIKKSRETSELICPDPDVLRRMLSFKEGQ